MKTLEVIQLSDDQQVLRLAVEVPVERARQAYRVTFTIEDSEVPSVPHKGWPSGYLESVFGAWQGEFPEIADSPCDEQDSL